MRVALGELAQRAGLDLAHALAGHAERLADVLERASAFAVQAVAQGQDAAHAIRKRIERALQIADEPLFKQLQSNEAELEEFFILSDLTLVASDETSARVVRTARTKCARCWRHRETVGESAAHPELCDRCADAVSAQNA